MGKLKRGGHNRIDMTNTIFGSLTVLKYSHTNKVAFWICKCICGKKCISKGTDLRQGKIKTCGCRIGIKNKTNWQGYKDISKSYWQVINNNAKQRNLEFNITLKYIWKLFENQYASCALTGEEIILCPYNKQTASLDRIDSSKGYIKGNVQWVHKTINKLKNNFKEKEFVLWCGKVAAYA